LLEVFWGETIKIKDQIVKERLIRMKKKRKDLQVHVLELLGGIDSLAKGLLGQLDTELV
jgi:hypothetical protein